MINNRCKRVSKPARQLRPGRLICLVILYSALSTSNARALTASGLRCEHSVDPLGVDIQQPRLSWVVSGQERGSGQSAYQIQASTSRAALERGKADLWDTGRLASHKTLHIPYRGRPLTSSQAVFWRVRTWDQAGQEGPWSEVAAWTMGIVAPQDWQAQWIKASWDSESVLLRGEFALRPNVTRAIAHVCGLGHFEMWINGQRVGENLLSPGWTKYDKSSLYETHDVTALLAGGANVAALALGDGMYNTEKSARYSKFTGSFGPLRAIVQIDVEYADGSRQRVITDEAWQADRGPVTFTDVWGGEDYDARLAQHGWNKPGFNAASWDKAVRAESPGVLRGFTASAPPLRAIETLRPVGTKQMSPTQDVIDLGQNASIMPRITVTGPAGSTIRLTHAEVTHPDGSINRTGSGNAPAWWQYTKGTDAEETWFPQFFYAGCRYLQADRTPAKPGGPLPELADLEGVVVHSSAEPAGEFACSNELLNRIHQLVRWAQRSNMVSVLTDCPHREKLGWLEQYHLNGPAIRYEFDVTRILVKGVQDMRDSQTDAGFVPNIAPELTQFGGAFRAATEWGAAFIIVPWQHYQFTGDLNVCRENYPAMQQYMEYLAGRAKNHIITEGLGDWYDLGPVKPPGFAQLTPPPVTATAFYYLDAALMARTAAALGHVEDAITYAKLADEIRAAWRREFRHADTKTYATNSQCTNALALVLGLAESDDRATALNELIRDIRDHQDGVTTGDVGFRYLLLALGAAGRSDVIYDIVRQEERPGYAYQLAQGATSLTESWDANHTASQNHFMLGQVVEWMYQDLAGIAGDPSGPGFKRIIIRPSPVGDLEWARATYRSVRGPITSSWQARDAEFVLNITIPENTTATVYVPSTSAEAVSESGGPAAQAPGVQLLRHEDGRSIFSVASGTYEFHSAR